MPGLRPKPEKTGRITVRLSSAGIRDPQPPMLEEDLEQKIRDIVQAELGFLTSPTALGIGREGIQGIPGEKGDKGDKGDPGSSAFITAGAGIAKDGNTISVDIDTDEFQFDVEGDDGKLQTKLDGCPLG